MVFLKDDPGSILVCREEATPKVTFVVGYAYDGPEYCGNDQVSALYNNILQLNDFMLQTLHYYSFWDDYYANSTKRRSFRKQHYRTLINDIET